MTNVEDPIEKPLAEFADFPETKHDRWEAVTKPKFIGFMAGVALFFVILLKSTKGFFPLLDFANLLFHEAGHPIFGLLHNRLEIYGGTFGQLTFPIALMISFWRKNQTIPFAIAWIWLFENFLNIARYMADSRELILPLVGGGTHDWNEIFHRWHLLSYDTTIAAAVGAIGWIGMFAAVVWVAYRARQTRMTGLSSI